MEYNKKLSNCPECGKKPKLLKKDGVYFKYVCEADNLATFYSKSELTARELFNAQAKNIKNLRVRV